MLDRRESPKSPLALLLATSAVIGALLPACKSNDVQSSETCNFAPAAGASFCPPNTHPSLIVPNCNALDAAADDAGPSQCVPTNLNGCYVNCAQARCGDGYTDPGEQCDLGPQNGAGKGCDATCHLTQGMSCGTNGDLRCSPDKTIVQVCQDNLWQTKTACNANQVCDSVALQCANAPNYCSTPGAFRCVSDVDRQVCGSGSRWTEAPCPTDMPLCASISGVVSCQAGGNVISNSQYRAKVTVGSTVGTTAGPAGSAIIGEPPVH